MHGAPWLPEKAFGDPRPTKLWWAGLGTPTFSDDAERPCSLFRPTSPDQMFRARDLIGSDGVVRVEALDQLIRRLTLLIDHRGYNMPDRGNRGIPAGYTYFMQLMAHDLVNTVLSPQAASAVLHPHMRNARPRALVLDTLYGTDPHDSPQAYEYSATRCAIAVELPRTRLRVGPYKGPIGSQRTPYCPMRDIARMPSPDFPQSETSLLTEPLLADARNDAHAFMSQITILFQLLHNHILNCLPTERRPSSPATHARKRFLCARYIVTLIYRNIIVRDLLDRILNKAVLARYRSEAPQVLLDGAKGVPVEFSHGAFRFGHSMVRKGYKVASDNTLPTIDGLYMSSAMRPRDMLPIKEHWLVDWARFFEVGAIEGAPASALGEEASEWLNASRLIGPYYAVPLKQTTLFPGVAGRTGTTGLAYRDLVSGCYAGTLSVSELCRKLQSVFGADLVPDFHRWHSPLRSWLDANLSERFDPEEVERLVEDPPLVFFTMFEADKAERGQRLGPVASIIVAETIFGAMKANPIVDVPDGAPLHVRMKACAESLFPDNQEIVEAVARIDEIASMPELLDYLVRNHVFDRPAAST